MYLLVYQLNMLKKKSNYPAFRDIKPILYHSISGIAGDSKFQGVCTLGILPPLWQKVSILCPDCTRIDLSIYLDECQNPESCVEPL